MNCPKCNAVMHLGMCLCPYEQPKPEFAEGYVFDVSELSEKERAALARQTGDLK